MRSLGNPPMSNWLAKVREHHKRTQREVALALHTTDRTVSNWELRGGDPKLTHDQWIELCKLFGCTFDELGQIINKVTSKNP
jgi:DNA-binding XRE family transcriptional regulator